MCLGFLLALFLSLGGFHGYLSASRWTKIHECTGISDDNITHIVVEDTYYQFTAALYACFAVLHALAIWLIIVGCTGARKKREKEELIIRDIDQEIKRHPKRLCCIRFWKIVVTLFLLIPIIVFTVIGFVFDYGKIHCNYSTKDSVFIALYHIFFFITLTITAVVLLCMIGTTVHVYHIWEFQPNIKSDHSTVIFAKKSFEYQKRGKTVMLSTQAYKSWFVLHWSIYFLGIFTDLTYILRPWILGGEDGIIIYKQQRWDYIYIGVFVIFDFMMFLIPYGCGLVINHYHNEFYKDLVNNEKELHFLLKQGDENSYFTNASSFLQNRRLYDKIKKNTDYDFTPSIIGIDIPFESSGYTITIFISIITLTLSFLVQPLELKKVVH